MVKVNLPDGSVRSFSEKITPRQVAKDIGPGLAKAAVAAVVDGVTVGLETPLPSENVATAVLAGSRVALPLAGLFDVEAERSRLSRQMAELEKETARLEAHLSDERFRTRAPAAVVRQEEERLASARSRLDGLRARLRELE